MVLRCFFLRSAAAAAYFALAMVVSTLGFSQTIDQQNVGRVAIHYTDLNKGNDFELLQSFTAGITGTLERIALPVYEDVIIPPPYNKGVWYNSSATVTILNSKLAALGSTLIPAASIPNTSSPKAEQDALDVNALFKLSVTKGSLYFMVVRLRVSNLCYADTWIGSPRASTWVMMLIGFGGLSYAAFRRGGKSRLGDTTA